MSGVWGTITDSDWTDDDARVVCRRMGHFRPGIYCIAQVQTSDILRCFLPCSISLVLLVTHRFLP